MEKTKSYLSSEKNSKSYRIQIRCSKEIKDKIKAAADKAEKNITEYIISCCMPEEAEQRIRNNVVKAFVRDRILYQQSINDFIDYVRSRMGYGNTELENEIMKLGSKGEEYGFIKTDGTGK